MVVQGEGLLVLFRLLLLGLLAPSWSAPGHSHARGMRAAIRETNGTKKPTEQQGKILKVTKRHVRMRAELSNLDKFVISSGYFVTGSERFRTRL